MKFSLPFVAAASLVMVAPAAATVSVVPDETTYTFTGRCADCEVAGSLATATLVLAGYTPGTKLSEKYFVSFEYSSDKESFSSDARSPFSDLSVDNISGKLGSTEGAYNFKFSQDLFGLFPLISFATTSTGKWNYSLQGLDLDHGRDGVWSGVNAATSAVPEPVTWAMMIGGFGLVGGVMRRVHRRSEERFTSKVRSLARA